MAYARFGQDGSSVYVYLHVDGSLHCANCHLGGYTHEVRSHSTDEMIKHLEKHLDSGDTVPSYVIPFLLEDDSENFPATTGSDND